MLFDRLFRLIKSNVVSSKEKPHTTAQEDFSSSTYNRSTHHQTPPPPSVNTTEAAYYAALEITPGASFEEIKKAYKVMIKKYHPDRFPQDEQKKQYAEAVTRKLNEAFAYFEKKYGA